MGVAVVCLCVFLWMFLLGIWAGQTVLQPDEIFQTRLAGTGRQPPAADYTQKTMKKDKTPAPAQRVEKQTPTAVKTEQEEKQEQDISFFSLQVAAYKNPAGATEDVQRWQAKGYDAFLRPPEGADDSFTRVYVGRFERLADANRQAVKLEKTEKAKAFIALIQKNGNYWD
mgnify:CR=1 FL=1